MKTIISEQEQQTQTCSLRTTIEQTQVSNTNSYSSIRTGDWY